MIDAFMFLSGAILFLLSVLFFIYVWWQRGKVTQSRELINLEKEELLEERVELEIWQKELQVWYKSLEKQQVQLEQEREELRALASSQALTFQRALSPPEDAVNGSDDGAMDEVGQTYSKEHHWGKNLKHPPKVTPEK